MTASSAPDILLIIPEIVMWEHARSLSYTVTFAVEDGLRDCGCKVTTLPGVLFRTATEVPWREPTHWLRYARELLAGQRFDQVWIELCHVNYDNQFLEWIASLAPVRVGLVLESLTYPQELLRESQTLASKEEFVLSRIPFMTHVLAVDELDVKMIREKTQAEALYWRLAVPEQYISKETVPAQHDLASFMGALYKIRQPYVEYQPLRKLMHFLPSPEVRSGFAYHFDQMQHTLLQYFEARRVSNSLLEEYLKELRRLRALSFSLWLDSLKTYAVTVSLPAMFGGYPSRIYEAMAAGRPVVAARLQNRPVAGSAFEEGREILLYSSPAELESILKSLLSDKARQLEIAGCAREKLLEEYSAEKCAASYLSWIG